MSTPSPKDLAARAKRAMEKPPPETAPGDPDPAGGAPAAPTPIDEAPAARPQP